MTSSPSELAVETPDHLPAIEALLDTAFGPGRFAKTAYRLREANQALPELSLVVTRAGELIASIRFWPITIASAPALLLGPLVVHPDHKNCGHGLRLMRSGIERATAAGHRLVVLVGDEPYYARVGFRVIPPGQVRLPGPVDPARLLALELVPGALDGVSGRARPAPAGSAAFAVPGEGQGCEQDGEAEQAGKEGH